VWNDLAGGDGDYCAILVAFNSLLQMVLYAPFAIFYINVVRPPSQPSESVTVSYSVVARSVAVFLGNSVYKSALTFLFRYPSCRRDSHPPHPSESLGTETIPTKLHRLDRATFTHRLIIYDHHPLCITR
jgi:Sodium Bile acid symporter family